MHTNSSLAPVLDGLAGIGGALFLGGIAASVLIDTLIDGPDLAALATGRRFVSAIGHMIVMPGLVAATVGLAAAAVVRHGRRWPAHATLRLALHVVMLGVAEIWLLPALDAATAAALRSAAAGLREASYGVELARESGFGALNVGLFLIAGALDLWRPGLWDRSSV